ncbi:MAG: hypothetical protein O2V44_01635 [Candidatus Bathyarchaeota archaeon]|nr:hypothetical protein [Candidatus Bathyarchaeota archaeon]
MPRKSVLTNMQFWLSVIIVVIAISLASAIYLDLLDTHFKIGQYYLHHWFSLTGTFFIAFFTPAYYYLKRRYINRFKAILFTHVFGNLIAFMLISIHFAHQIGRPARFYPDLGTGVVLYPAVIVLVITGFLTRFNLVKSAHYLRFLHKSVTVTFYFVIAIHLLHGFGII